MGGDSQLMFVVNKLEKKPLITFGICKSPSSAMIFLLPVESSLSFLSSLITEEYKCSLAFRVAPFVALSPRNATFIPADIPFVFFFFRGGPTANGRS